jgi:Secretion system C-terminal sorting domain
MKNIIVSFLLCYLNVQVFAQNVPGVQTPCTTSGQNTVANFNITYTIGEMPLIQTFNSNGLMITQGIIQPNTFIADTIYECFSQTEVVVFPNPNPGFFSLRLSMFKKGYVSIRLFDMAGHQLLFDDFAYNTFTTKQFDINKYASGQYFLQLFFTEAGASNPKKCIYTIQKIK